VGTRWRTSPQSLRATSESRRRSTRRARRVRKLDPPANPSDPRPEPSVCSPNHSGVGGSRGESTSTSNEPALGVVRPAHPTA
jgi:hypothetical protein